MSIGSIVKVNRLMKKKLRKFFDMHWWSPYFEKGFSTTASNPHPPSQPAFHR